MLRRIGIVVAVVLVLIQFVRPARTNPPIDPTKTLRSTGRPAVEVTAILDRACRDCHSSETRWPWYSHVAPVSWLVTRDVNVGRKELSFSTWGDYDARRRARKLEEICEQVRAGEMPQFPYPLMHPEARLTDRDTQVICGWTDRERAALAGERRPEGP